MSTDRGPWWARLLIVLYGFGVVVIAGHQISVKYVGKKVSVSGLKGRALVEQLHGEVDVAKASVSPQYVEKYAAQAQEKAAPASSSAASKKEGERHLDTKALGSLLDKLAP